MNSTPTATVRLHALRLSAEQAAGRYRAAHRDVTYQAQRTASLFLLVRQHPTRVDYRAAWETARSDFITAQQRAARAYDQYVTADLRIDTAWTQQQAGAA